MSCIVKENAIESLVNSNIIDSNNNILNLDLFNKANERLTEIASTVYGVGVNNMTLLSIEDSYEESEEHGVIASKKMAVNDKLFDILQEAQNTNLVTDDMVESFINYDRRSYDGELEDTKDIDIKTLEKITSFIDAIGVSIKLEQGEVKNKLLKDDSELVATSNVIEKTITLLDNKDSREKLWNSLPEEAAHFYIKMLAHSEVEEHKQLYSELKVFAKEFYKNNRDEVESLKNKGYKKSKIKEEILAKEVAKAILGSKEEVKPLLERVVDFIKKFIGIYQKKVKVQETTPISTIAANILSSNIEGLPSAEALSFTYKYNYLLDNGYNYTSIKEDNLRQLKDDNVIMKSLKEYRPRTKYLSKTIAKLNKAILEIIYNPVKKTKINDTLRGRLEEVNSYKNVTPSLESFDLLKKKYSKNSISLSSPIKLSIKKDELKILNKVREKIKEENSTMKSIKVDEFIEEVNTYLKLNFLLGFAEEKKYLDYNVKNTFFKTTGEEGEVKHRKISLRFNDEYFSDSTPHFNYSPSSFGNITYFYSDESSNNKDAALLHEIQNDFIEKLIAESKEDIDIVDKEQKVRKEVRIKVIEHLKYSNLFRSIDYTKEEADYDSFKGVLSEYKELYNIDKAKEDYITASKLVDKRFNDFFTTKEIINRNKGYLIPNNIINKIAEVIAVSSSSNPELRLIIREITDNLVKKGFEEENVSMVRRVILNNITNIVEKGHKINYYFINLKLEKHLIDSAQNAIYSAKEHKFKALKGLKAAEKIQKISKISEKQYSKIYTNIRNNINLFEEYVDVKKEFILSSEKSKEDLNTELHYFTPLVHKLIQTIIEEKGKDFPTYFSGFDTTLRTQGSPAFLSALIYAGKEEVSLNPKYDSIDQMKVEATGVVNEAFGGGIRINSKGILEGGQSEAIKKAYNSTLYKLNNKRPWQVGALWVAFNKTKGIRLEYQEEVKGIKGENNAIYKVNLENYSYSNPMLFTESKRTKLATFDDVFDSNQPKKLSITKAIPETKEENEELVSQVLFNNSEEEMFTAEEVLDNIIKNYEAITPHTKELVYKAKILMKLSNAKVILTTAEELNTGYEGDGFMAYDGSTNTIYIAKDLFSENGLDYSVESILHEVIHSVTVNAYKNKSTPESLLFVDFIDKAYEFYNKNGSKSQGFKDVFEFMSELIVDKEFQQEIKDLDKKGLWDKFIDFVRMLFGLPKVNKEFSYNNLVEEIMTFAKSDANDIYNQGYNFTESKSDINEEIEFMDVSTLDKKLDHTLKLLNISIDEGLKSFTDANNRSRDEKRKKSIRKQITNLETIKNAMNEVAKTNKVFGINSFVIGMERDMRKIATKFLKLDITDEKELEYHITTYRKYLSRYAIIEDIRKTINTIKRDRNQNLITDKDLTEMLRLISVVEGSFSGLISDLYDLSKLHMRFKFNDKKYFSYIVNKHKEKLSTKFNQLGLSKSGVNKTEWISKQLLNEDSASLAEDIEKELTNLLENPLVDIASSEVIFGTATNSSNYLVQIFQQLLDEVNNKRLSAEKEYDVEAVGLFNDLVKEKGTTNINKLYENILEYDSSGKPFIKSDFSAKFHTDFFLKIRKMRGKASELSLDEKYGINSDEYKNAVKDIEKFEAENVIIGKTREDTVVKNKWKNDLSNLSETEEKVRSLFIRTLEHSSEEIRGYQNLINFEYNTKFYELPKVTKSDAERLWFNKGSNIIKDKFKDLTEVRPDDIGYISKNIALDGSEARRLKVFYRAGENFSNEDQSLDLFNIFRLEFKNANIFKTRVEYESYFNTLVDISKNKEFYKMSGTRFNKSIRTNNPETTKIGQSNTFKMMTNMLESRVYDVLHKSGSKFGKFDIDKAISKVNSGSAFLALSLNLASNTANVLNAQAQLFLESFIKGHFITASSIAKANKMYGSDLVNILGDFTNGLNVSKTNQIIEMFHGEGLFNLSHSNFLKASLLRKGLNTDILQIGQDSGEHWLQSVITFSVLDGIKVMNENSKFINKEGKEVKEKDAASLLDMIVKKDNGSFDVSDKVVYTTHSTVTKFHEGGKEKVDSLIRKKLYDSVGNYREIDQPDIMRHWYGKLAFLFRKYLVTMGQARFRGFSSALTLKGDLKDYQKNYSYALQLNEEGTYTTSIRAANTIVKYLMGRLKGVEKELLTYPSWDNLTDYEKHNIKRAVMEVLITTVLLPLAVSFVKGAAGDDRDYLFFVAYQLRRMDTELSQYFSISEMFKIMRSPVPSARIIETGISTVTNLLNPFNWNEEDIDKINKKLLKQAPVYKEYIRNYEDLLKFQESSFGGSM